MEKMLGFPSDPKKNGVSVYPKCDCEKMVMNLKVESVKSPSQTFPWLGALKRMKVVTYNINRNHCITKPNTAGRKEEKITIKIGGKHFLGGGWTNQIEHISQN